MSVTPSAPDWVIPWTEWVDFTDAVDGRLIPSTPGLYRFRERGGATLAYVGISVNRRSRLRTLRKFSKMGSASFITQPGEKRPFRGHYAAPALARAEERGQIIEVSWSAQSYAERQEREAVELRAIKQHRLDTGAYPPWQHGGRGAAAT